MGLLRSPDAFIFDSYKHVVPPGPRHFTSSNIPLQIGGRHSALRSLQISLADSDGKHRDRSSIESLHREANLVAFSLLCNHVKERQVMIRCWN